MFGKCIVWSFAVSIVVKVAKNSSKKNGSVYTLKPYMKVEYGFTNYKERLCKLTWAV